MYLFYFIMHIDEGRTHINPLLVVQAARRGGLLQLSAPPVHPASRHQSKTPSTLAAVGCRSRLVQSAPADDHVPSWRDRRGAGERGPAHGIRRRLDGGDGRVGWG